MPIATETVTGMIDIGSNTVRLAVYQATGSGAYRVVDQGRWPARLSQRLTADGALPPAVIEELAEVLRHYKRICDKHGASRIRAVATAAIRQSTNRDDVLAALKAGAGLDVELLSGEDEARLGSVAMLRTMDVADGYLIDIGGGSTEISLIRGRRAVASCSLPVGCVNSAVRFGVGDGAVTEEQLERIAGDIRQRLLDEPWTARHPGLPLIGLGGTVRALAKVSQRLRDYPLPQLHGYEMRLDEIDAVVGRLAGLTVDKRRKTPGLSKDRADVILPGLAILRAIYRHCGASRLIVSGAGLRDGLFYETCLPPAVPGEHQVLEESIRNLNALYPAAPTSHLEQVRRLALSLYERLAPKARFGSAAWRLLDAAARLFRIGAIIDYHDSADHTFYMLTRAHWNGLSHREIVLTAAIASYRGTGALRRKLSPYKSILREGDSDIAARLGVILLLAAALDRSESQAITALNVNAAYGRLTLVAAAPHPLPVEKMEVDGLAKEFKKVWGLTPILQVTTD